MNLSYKNLKQIEESERKLYQEKRSSAHKQVHKIKGNFISLFGRQYKPFFEGDVGFRPLFGGFYIKYNDLELLVDPGINTLDRAQKIGINLFRINTLFISHGHIDHHNDTDAVLELASTKSECKTNILISNESLKNRSVSPYLFEIYPEKFSTIQLQNRPIKLYNNVVLTPVKVNHSIVGSYGFVLDLDDFKIGYTGDTGFTQRFKTTTGEYPIGEEDYNGEIIGPTEFDNQLKSIFGSVDILLFNLHNFSYKKNSTYHSTAFDLIELLKDSKIKMCICDHFNPESSVGSDYPKAVIEFIKQKTQKNVRLVGQNGLKIPLD